MNFKKTEQKNNQDSYEYNEFVLGDVKVYYQDDKGINEREISVGIQNLEG